MARIVSRIPITKARTNLGQVARRAHVNRAYVILEKDGIPVAGVLSADELEDYLEMQKPGLKTQIRKSTEEYRRGESQDAGTFLAPCVANRLAPRSERPRLTAHSAW